MHLLVTGGTGLLGSHLVRTLVDQGHHVTVLARHTPDNPIHKVKYVKGSVLDNPLPAIDSNTQGIFHLAAHVNHSRINTAPEEQELAAINNILRAIHNAQHYSNGKQRIKLVYASSSGVAAIQAEKGAPANEQDTVITQVLKHWPYYHAKAQAEISARNFAKKNDIDVVFMRPSLLLGPGDENLASSKIVLDFIEESLLFVPPGGISFVDVRDAAEAFATVMTKSSTSDVYFLSSCNCSIFDFFVVLQEITGIERPPFSLSKFPLLFAANLSTFLNGLVTRYDATVDPVWAEMGCVFWDCSSQKAQNELGFKPRDPRLTLKDTVAWIEKNKKTLRKAQKKGFFNYRAAAWSYRVLFVIILLYALCHFAFSYKSEILHTFAEFRAFSKDQFKRNL
jgi:dihydroflavonol-4-reductase